jgi:hypothetical protein
MVFFIFVLILMFSLSGVLYLMVRALPRVAEVEGESGGSGAGAAGIAAVPGRRGLLDRWAHSELPERIDGAFNTWFLKFLRKFKVFTLKLDNAITKHLHKIHSERETNEKKSAIDFKEINESKDKEEK